MPRDGASRFFVCFCLEVSVLNANYAKYIETVKTNILITLVLVMGMTLAGFSKEESENMSMEEKQVADIKQHIIGTWEHDEDLCATTSVNFPQI